MNKVLPVLYGPTSSGKTGYALSLPFPSNILSADSRQVYRYMDIGTGKDVGNAVFKRLKTPKIINKDIHWGYYLKSTPKNSVKIWLLDLINPSQTFSSVDWSLLAVYLVENYKNCIVVGGAGYYIKTLIDGIQNYSLSGNTILRKNLEKLNVGKLQEMLKDIWPDRFARMNNSDRNNPRRLVRAIEIAQSNNSDKSKRFLSNVTIKGIYLVPDLEYLRTRIQARAKERFKKGLLDEIASLLKKGYGWDDPGMNTMGYREFQPYFSSKRNKDECYEKWVSDEIKYARKQLLWFRDDKRFVKILITEKSAGSVEKKITSLLNEKA